MEFIDGDLCPVCESPTKRHPFSDYFLCANFHTIYLGEQEKIDRFELREHNPITLDAFDFQESRRKYGGGFFSVWDLMADQPFYDTITDEYAYLINEGRARSLVKRLNGD